MCSEDSRYFRFSSSVPKSSLMPPAIRTVCFIKFGGHKERSAGWRARSSGCAATNAEHANTEWRYDAREWIRYDPPWRCCLECDQIAGFVSDSGDSGVCLCIECATVERGGARSRASADCGRPNRVHLQCGRSEPGYRDRPNGVRRRTGPALQRLLRGCEKLGPLSDRVFAGLRRHGLRNWLGAFGYGAQASRSRTAEARDNRSENA